MAMWRHGYVIALNAAGDGVTFNVFAISLSYYRHTLRYLSAARHLPAEYT